jgi:predicted dehydrogenase/threonine dehydrogenase-like Zn-dependent dehydrogenase
MKQVLQDRKGLTVVRDVPAPPCGSGSVLVRNAFSAISSGTERSRLVTAQKSLVGKALERPDLVRDVIDRARREGIAGTRDAVKRRLAEETAVGYSSAGYVIEVGSAVRGFGPGDAVACAGGGHANHAEVVSVPANLCAKVPAGVSMEAAAMTTIAAIALHGVRLADVTIGDRVAVVGCGLVGQIACRLLQAAGAQVFALDLDPTRVEQARTSGVDRAYVVDADVADQVLAASGGIGVDKVLVTAAARSSEPLLLAARIARDRGAMVLVGDVPIELPRALLYEKELSFRVSRSYGPGRYDLEYEERGLDYPLGYVRWTEQRNMECVLQLQATGELELGDLVEILPLDRAADAYQRLLAPPAERPTGALLLAYDGREEKESDTRSVELTVSPRPVAARSKAAPVRIGLIGPGSFAGRVLVPALIAGGARLELVGGGSGPSAEAAMRTSGFARVASSAGAVINDESVNAVVIATRHGSHAALVRQALELGKHVFCEKPVALTVDELNAVLDAAVEADGILAVGFNRRFSPLLRELREFVSSGPSPLAATYRISAGPLAADHWAHDLEQGGGRVIGEGCHFVDSLTYVAGSEVVEVHAAGFGDPQLPAQARDNVVITLSFANGSVGSILYVSEGSGRVPKERIEVFSGNRTAVLDDYRTLELFGASRKEKRSSRNPDKGHRVEIDSFLRGVERGEPPVALAEIANVSLATLAAVESLRTGQAIRVAVK